jgi:hypothetical protein
MSRANKELLAVNSLLANLVLHRDAVLGPQRYKKDVVFRKTRCSSFVPTHVFGPEAQAAVDAYKSDPATALRELKQLFRHPGNKNQNGKPYGKRRFKRAKGGHSFYKPWNKQDWSGRRGRRTKKGAQNRSNPNSSTGAAGSDPASSSRQ